MKKLELDQIIQLVKEAGFHVFSVTCNSAPVNRTLSIEYGITDSKTSHPSRPGNKIFWLFDTVHMEKLMRNHLIYKGFTLKNGKRIGPPQFKKFAQRKDSKC